MQGHGQDVTDDHAGVDTAKFVYAYTSLPSYLTIVPYFLEQNPYAGLGPIVGKVMIVCPVSLINVRMS